MLRADVTSFEQVACLENFSRLLTEGEMEQVEANDGDQEPGSYMEAPIPEFENASTWVDIAVDCLWIPYMTVSRPTDDGSLYQGQIFGSKGKVVHSLKTSFIRSHQ